MRQAEGVKSLKRAPRNPCLPVVHQSKHLKEEKKKVHLKQRLTGQKKPVRSELCTLVPILLFCAFVGVGKLEKLKISDVMSG